MREGFLVTETIEGTHPKHPEYPLLKGDLLVEHEDGSFGKEAPGLCVVGFVLTEEQKATLKPVPFNSLGLYYQIGTAA